MTADLVAVVPARGGSKGVAGKNLALVGGRSLVRRAVEAATRSSRIAETIVSSDAADILREGEAAGATSVARSPTLAQDDTPTIEVLRSLLDHTLVRARRGIILLQPTSPFRSVADIDACADALAISPTATTACLLEHPVEWTFALDANGRPLGLDTTVRRRQDAPPRYRLAGSVYAATIEHLRGGAELVDASTTMIVVPAERALDIDTPIDLATARALADRRDPAFPSPEDTER